jgi:phospholipid-binding lipoprotein MlaA
MLANSPSAFLFHNADDVTMAPGEIDQLQKIFGSRATIYPHGGHCGNLTYRTNVADLLAVFREGEKGEGAEGEQESTAPQEQPEPAPTEVEPTGMPPVLTMDIAPVPPESPEAEPAEFTAPRRAYAYTSEVEAELARRRTPEAETGRDREEEIVPARRGARPGLSYIIDVYDPLEPMNRGIYKFNAVFDEYVFLPVTRAYEFITPVFVQDRISGIFSNISDVRSLSNALLQLRPVKSGKILTRFLINSTVGLAGMWDPAARLGFPKYVEDFGQTLGRYGLGPGPYIMLPILGPSSARDTTGLAADATAQYFYLYQPTDMDVNKEYGIPYTTMNAIDTRHNIPFRYYQTGSPFEYDLLRLLYRKKRELDIEQ